MNNLRSCGRRRREEKEPVGYPGRFFLPRGEFMQMT
nr:MAG TPA: hypothetical protein [Caudoviricetes sp.]